MEADNFKNKLSEIKYFLKGKQIELEVTDGRTKGKIEVFNSLKLFGLKFLELYRRGAGFEFSIVSNNYTERFVDRKRTIDYYTKNGVWTKIKISATIKYE